MSYTLTALGIRFEMSKARAGAKEFTGITNQMNRAAANANKGVGRLDKGMQTFGKTANAIKGTVARLAAGFTAFMVIRDMTRTIAQFSESMSTVQAVTRANDETMASLTQRARELGATTKFTASQAAEGMLYLSRAGFSANETIAAIGGTLNLAIAGAIGLGEAADYTSNIIRQFSMSAEEATRVADVLVYTSNNANTNVTEMAEAMKYAGSIAGTLNQPLEQVAAMIGALGDRGIKASQAGTNMRMMMIHLLNPTSQAEKALHELNLSVDKVNPAMLDLVTVFQRLSGAGLGSAENAAKAVEIFGARNVAAAQIITNNISKIKNFNDEIIANKNAAEEASRVMQNNLAYSFKSLRSAVEEVYLATGDAGYTGALKDMVDTMTGALRVLSGMETSTIEISDASYLLADALKAIVISFTAFVALKLAIVFREIALAIKATSGALGALRVVMASHPIGFAAAVIGTAVTAYLALESQVSKTARAIEDFNNRYNRSMEKLSSSTDEFLKLLDQSMAMQGMNLERDIQMTNEMMFMLNKLKSDIAAMPGEMVPVQVLRAWEVFNAEINTETKKLIETLKKAEDEYYNAISDWRAGGERGMPPQPPAALVDVGRSFSNGIAALFDKQTAIRIIDDYWNTLNAANEMRKAKFAKGELAKESLAPIVGESNINQSSDQLKNYFADLDATSNNTAESMANAFGTAFEQMALNIDNFSSAAESAFRSLAQAIFHEFVTKGLVQLLASLFGGGSSYNTLMAGIQGTIFTQTAKGGAFRGGHLIPFAYGGVAYGPTVFPMAGGATGLMGEQGPEAVMPLKRTSTGELGVKAEGGGATYNVVMNITTPDANSFRRSKRQIERDFVNIGRR